MVLAKVAATTDIISGGRVGTALGMALERAEHVVVLLLDGCNANLLHDAIDAGEAPHIAGLVARGTDFGADTWENPRAGALLFHFDICRLDHCTAGQNGNGRPGCFDQRGHSGNDLRFVRFDGFECLVAVFEA